MASSKCLLCRCIKHCTNCSLSLCAKSLQRAAFIGTSLLGLCKDRHILHRVDSCLLRCFLLPCSRSLQTQRLHQISTLMTQLPCTLLAQATVTPLLGHLEANAPVASESWLLSELHLLGASKAREPVQLHLVVRQASRLTVLRGWTLQTSSGSCLAEFKLRTQCVRGPQVGSIA